ncbi:hypothetical protein MIZ03_2150 [Rhodoferax lithotrophicus]|uniref:Uncharacterized protein n=1 Tax=Rhodoferax lithotrophicus TaxID=2798804 RepID=A0ABM7MMB8_9BURK|nr:hypothetical protein [Rhodoferax sp. MIZ03]BCO27262.1 hypothetical protein MIZ03_2150 [Rhodoferax sp. MIZ03]
MKSLISKIAITLLIATSVQMASAQETVTVEVQGGTAGTGTNVVTQQVVLTAAQKAALLVPGGSITAGGLLITAAVVGGVVVYTGTKSTSGTVATTGTI